MRLPRGIRNKNPGNIEISAKFTWQGEVRPGTDKRFCTFQDPIYGLRAMMKLLINYNQKHHILTLRDAIARYAPSNENNTKAYVKAVAKAADINPDAEYDFTRIDFLVPVTKAMVVHENGHPHNVIGGDYADEGFHPNWYSDAVYQSAYELAVKGRITTHSMNHLHEKPLVEDKPKPPRGFWCFIKGIF